jgi:N-acetylglucosaminyl-diphospho-decaprenol L-rhamnosyltransferase
MDEPSSLDVVIVSYRSRELLRSCLAALREFPAREPFRIIVVDNASRDGTVEMVTREFPEVRVIAADRNLGFSAANNLAIGEGDSAYVLALNPDTRVTEDALNRLVAFMDAHSQVGICGCRLELEDGTLDHAAKRSFPTVLGALGHFTGFGRRRSEGALAQYRAPEVEAGPVDAVNGAFMLMRRSALEETGLFDEGYWMYMEDLDLCFRFRQAGHLVWYEPSVSVVHVKHGSSGDVRSPRLDYAFHYGMYRFYRKHYAASRYALANATVYAGIGVKLCLSVARGGAVRLIRRSQPHPRPSTRAG